MNQFCHKITNFMTLIIWGTSHRSVSCKLKGHRSGRYRFGASWSSTLIYLFIYLFISLKKKPVTVNSQGVSIIVEEWARSKLPSYGMLAPPAAPHIIHFCLSTINGGRCLISKLILPLSVYYWLQLTIMYLELSERDYSSSPWGPTSPRGRLLRGPFIAHAQFEGSPSCSLAQLGDPVESIYHKWLSRNRIKFHKVWVYLKIKALSIRWTYPLQNTRAHFFVNQYQSYVDPMAVFPASDTYDDWDLRG